MNYRGVNHWPTTGNLKRVKFLQTEFSFGCWTLIAIHKNLAPSSTLILKSILIISSHVWLRFSEAFPLEVANKILLCICYFFHACFIYFPIYPPLLDHPMSNNTSSRTGLKNCSVPHSRIFFVIIIFLSYVKKNCSQLYDAMNFVGNIVNFCFV
jgi:hypothetical protein